MVPPPTASPRERRSDMRRSTAPAGLTSSHHKMPSRQGRGAACMKPRSRSASWRMSTSSVQVQAATSARPATSCCWQEAKKLQAHAWRGKLRRTSYIYVFASPTQDPSVLRTRIFPQNHFASDLLPRHFINSAHLAAGMDSCTSTPTWRSHTEPEACSPARRLTSICTHANSYLLCHKLARHLGVLMRKQELQCHAQRAPQEDQVASKC